MNILVLILGILPGFVWLLFYLREDIDHEPKKEIFYVFLAGSGITFIALGFEYLLSDAAKWVSVNQCQPQACALWSVLFLFILAAIEEFFKFSAAFLAVSRSKYFDIPLDAMIYMIVVALGFATVENIGALSGQLRQGTLVSDIVSTTMLRFVGATLLHTLSSATVGYYWARGIIKGRLFGFIALGLLAGTLLHAFFNFLVIKYEDAVIYPVILLVIVAFFVINDFEKLKINEATTN